jgi:hypothetical protein
VDKRRSNARSRAQFTNASLGVRWRLGTGRDKGSTYTLVFDRHTYQLLGMNWTGRLGVNGASGGEALVKLAIVSKAGQVPCARGHVATAGPRIMITKRA